MTHGEKVDKKLLQALEQQACTTRELADRFSVPLATVVYRLCRLQKLRKVGKTTRKGTPSIWHVRHGSLYGKRSVRVFEGATFYEGIAVLWKLPKDSVVYAFQGRDSVKYAFKYTPRSFMVASQRAIKRKRLLIKAFSPEKIAKTLQILDAETVREHLNRRVVDKVPLKGLAFRGSAEIVVSRKWFLTINPRLKRCVVIHDPDTAGLVCDVAEMSFMLLDEPKQSVQTFDLNEFFRSILEKRTS